MQCTKCAVFICDKSYVTDPVTEIVTCHKNVVSKTYEIVSFGHLIGQIENFNLLLLKFTARKFQKIFFRSIQTGSNWFQKII